MKWKSKCDLCILLAEWENEEQFNGSPPRPQPRGPRTPPGPPPPDDDDEEAMPAPGQCTSVWKILYFQLRTFLPKNSMFILIIRQPNTNVLPSKE